MKDLKPTLLFLLVALLFSITISAQNERPQVHNFQNFINQVYTGDGVEQIQPSTRRYAYMKELFENRIVYTKKDMGKLDLAGYTLLSQIPLYDTYNKSLTRDESFNPRTFNPFKYQFLFYTKKTLMIRVDGTEYVIVIYPQESTQTTK